MLALLAAACQPAPLGAPPADASRAPADTGWSEPAREPPDDPCFDELLAPGDLTGDGIGDALFFGRSCFAADRRAAAYIVAGPLRGRRLDPEADATTILVSEGLPQPTDLEGDGRLELLLWRPQPGERTRFFAVPTPLPEGVVVPGEDVGGEIVERFYRDIDGDGLLETETITEDYRVEYHRLGELDGPPFLEIDPSCAWPDDPDAYATSYDIPAMGGLDAYPDVDGDGVRELYWAGLSQDGIYDLPCMHFWLDATVRGRVDPVTDTHRRARPPRLVGDQNQDGHVDACDWGGLALGPFDLTGKRAEPSAFVARPELCARVPFDLDGDGAGDFEDIVDRQWVIRAGGAAAGEGAAPVLAVLPAEAHGHVYFFEEGVAAVLYLLPPEDRAAVVAATADLGPATPRGLLE